MTPCAAFNSSPLAALSPCANAGARGKEHMARETARSPERSTEGAFMSDAYSASAVNGSGFQEMSCWLTNHRITSEDSGIKFVELD